MDSFHRLSLQFGCSAPRSSDRCHPRLKEENLSPALVLKLWTKIKPGFYTRFGQYVAQLGRGREELYTHFQL